MGNDGRSTNGNGSSSSNGNRFPDNLLTDGKKPFDLLGTLAGKEPPLTPIYHASDDHGHSAKFYFKATPGFDNVLEDALRQYPMFRNRGTLIRSVAYWGITKLVDEGNNTIALSPDALEAAIEAELTNLSALKRISDYIPRWGAELSESLEKRDFRVCFESLMRMAHLINEANISWGWRDHYWRVIYNDPAIQRVTTALEQQTGFDMNYWYQTSPEFL